MRNSDKLFHLCGLMLLVLLFGSIPSLAQKEIKNGAELPTRGMTRVLILLAEVDFSQGPCPQGLGLAPDVNGSWPVNQVTGDTEPPVWIDQLFDAHPLQPSGAYLTSLYRRASFGHYELLGDYYPKVFTIPCRDLSVKSDGVAQVLDRLAAEPVPTLQTAQGLSLTEFDNWNLDATTAGEMKLAGRDGKVDSLYIIWRNNRLLTGTKTICGAGYGVVRSSSPPFRNMAGINTRSSFNACHSANEAFAITFKEHMHGLYGDNDWHTGGGAGVHTFFTFPWSYGLTAQLATMRTVNAWDRWMLEWKHPNKQLFISAGEGINEVPSELSIVSYPQGGSFLLRDFLTTGDSVRIQLPHIEWQALGDPKNQYLWLENRQMGKTFDDYYTEACADNKNGQFPRGASGIYAHIQVGKDQKKGNDIYSSDSAHPNALASWFMPFTAEGNYDFDYRLDRIQPADGGKNCNWGNINVPTAKDTSLPNPFTGFSDLNGLVDSNNDGRLFSGDVLVGLSELAAGQVIHNFHTGGDWEDAFGPSTGRMEISLSTNPAPVPVYTYRYRHGAIPTVGPSENRTIWLNGLSIELEEAQAPQGAIWVHVRWDDYTVDRDVRWTGNIVLSPHDFQPGQPSLILAPGQVLWLDWGSTPTRLTAQSIQGRSSFSYPTRFTASPGSVMSLQQDSLLLIDHHSELRLERDSLLEVAPGARLVIRQGGRLVIEDGAELLVHDGGLVHVESTGELSLENRASGRGLHLGKVNSNLDSAELRISGRLTTAAKAPLTFSGDGFIAFDEGASLDLGPDSSVNLRGTKQGDLLLRLGNDVKLDIDASTVLMQAGRIEYGDRAQLVLEGGRGIFVSMELAATVAGRDATGIVARKLTYLSIVRSRFEDLETGAALTNLSSLTRFAGVVFKGNRTGIRAEGLANLQVTASHFTDGGTGLDLKNIPFVTLIGSDITSHGVALAAEDLERLSISGGRIGKNEHGVRAFRTDVFVRNGAVIEDHKMAALAVEGEPGKLARLVVGDLGCGLIRRNGLAVSGRDVLLELDAFEHWCPNGQPCSEARVNRFHDNNQLFEVCYTNSPSFAEVLARGNFWRANQGPDPQLIRIEDGCGVQRSPIPLLTTPFVDQEPTGCGVDSGSPVIDVGPILPIPEPPPPF